MKRFLCLVLVLMFMLSCISVLGFAEEDPVPVESNPEEMVESNPEVTEEVVNATGTIEDYVPPAEPEVEVITHRVTITWMLDTTGDGNMDNLIANSTLIGSTSFDASAGDVIDISSYKDNPAGASYWQPGFINYNGIPCIFTLSIGMGGKGINPTTGEPIDGYPLDIDPFSNLVMPDTDVDIYYFYMPWYPMPDVPEDTLDKIVIYVNRPTGDINPVRQEYHAYEILHVGKAPTVQEDVTTDWTVGTVDPDQDGFSYWIAETDPWFDVVNSMTDYFILTETSTEGIYIVILNPDKPATEDTAKEIAAILEENIEGKPEKKVTADTPSYDNDPGYYLIVSDINSNLVLGTTNIAITEKAEYPKIEKEVAEVDKNAGIGQEVTFTVTTHFPQGSKADAILSDVMTNGLTYVDDSLSINVDNYNLDVGHAADGNIVNGFTITIAGDVLKSLASGETGYDVVFSYKALVNNNAIINAGANINSVRLDFSHFAQSATAEVNVTSFNVLKYDVKDETKTPLAGARFQLLDAEKNPIKLVIIQNNKEYRIATDADDPAVITEEFITADSQILIKGVDADLTYYLREIAAPAGYNLTTSDPQVIAAVNGSTIVEVPNGSGTVLPSTGGIGTTIFYIVGGCLILVAAVFLITKKRMGE